MCYTIFKTAGSFWFPKGVFMKSFIIHTAICLSFYLLGAYATTDILRLLKGSSTPVNAPDCCCPICGQKIALQNQLPIISYFRSRGSCRHCKSPIPAADLFLEIFLFLLLSTVSCAMGFNWLSFWICIALYEGTKAIFLLRFGKRENAFLQNLAISLGINLLLFALTAFLFALAQSV